MIESETFERDQDKCWRQALRHIIGTYINNSLLKVQTIAERKIDTIIELRRNVIELEYINF